MTLLDLIRKLHAEGKPAAAYDLFICENSLMEPEEAVSVGDDDTTIRITDPYIPPQYLSLGDFPSYVYVEDEGTYKKLTQDGSISAAKKFPRLLVFVSLQMEPQEFLHRYFGCMWNDVPPMEWNFVEAGQYTPYLDKLGCVIDFLENGMPRSPQHMDYYKVRSEYGNEFAWAGDLSKDRLPKGLTVIDAPDLDFLPD